MTLDATADSKKFVKIFFRAKINSNFFFFSVVVSLFTFSINFFLSASVYDDIIKLTIEHLTFTLVHWKFPWCSLANRKINIHSCIQRTWLLLCEFYTIFSLSSSWIQEGGRKNYFSSAIAKFCASSFGNIVLCSSFIFNWSISLWVVVSMYNQNGLGC